MSILGDWYIADTTDAPAIAASVETEDHSHHDWPHLGFRDVSETALGNLFGILHGKPGSHVSIVDELVHPDEPDDTTEVYVYSLLPEFITVLTNLTDATIPKMAKQWQRDDEMEDWSAKNLEVLLREMSEFARKSQELGKPVLRLATM